MELCIPYINQNYWDSLSNEYQNAISDEDEIEYANVTSKVFERSRIKALADEREHVQKKTFTKWINSSLIHINMKINDLYIDLRDGKFLLALLEILSSEIVPKPTRGRMRIHCLENVDKCLGFLFNQKVHLENVGAHDIVDGNPRLTLGLIWTIILRFQVQDIQFDEDYSPVAKSAKDALLLWCQMKTAGYPSVNIRNFTNSWRTGLGFVAIIHKHRPDLIDFSSCNRSDNISNLQLAFQVAENSLGIPSLLEPEDINVPLPDERSVITYVASYYHYFNKFKVSTVLNKRLNKLLNQVLEDEQMIQLYQNLVTKLLEWIRATIKLLNVRQFANSISGVQQQMNAFNVYRIEEKPQKFVEKVDLEVLLFTIKSNQFASRLKVYNAPDEFNLAIINTEWEKLNTAEYEREMALRKELMRLEKLRNLAQKFMKKATLRESWISDNLELLSKQTLGNNLSTVLAALKKHEAIETDIYAYEENLIGFTKIADNLEQERYSDITTIISTKNKVLEMWKKLLHILHERREHLDNHLLVYNLLNEFNDIQVIINSLSSRLKLESYGKHLMEVEELLGAHELIESEIKQINQRLEKLIMESDRYIRYSDKDFRGNSSVNKTMVKDKKNMVVRDFHDLLDFAEARKQALKHSHLVWQCIVDVSLEEQWIKELLNIMNNPDLGNDLNSVDRLLKKHKIIESELGSRRTGLENKLLEGKRLVDISSIGSDLISLKNNDIQDLWESLVDATESKKIKLLEMLDFYQYISECDDLESWIDEFKLFFDLKHLGDKLSYTEILIKKNQQNMEVIQDRMETINQLQATAQSLMNYSIIDHETVSTKLQNVEIKFQELIDLAHKMQEKLLDTLTVYRLLNDADSVRTWITEKEKFLVNFIPSDDIEELEILKHRFEVFESELTKRAEKVYHVNTLSENLVTNGNPNHRLIIQNQDDLNNTWNKMADIVDGKRDELLSTYHYSNFFLDCQQTIEWIREKIQLIDSIDQIGDGLDNILQRQRRISHLQRDICAIEAKIDHLVGQGDLIIRSNLGNPSDIEQQLDLVHGEWEKLKQMIRDRDSTLANINDIHRFLEKLDDFQIWLGQMQTEMASQNIPESLSEVEKMINDYNQQREEMAQMEQQLHQWIGMGEEFMKTKDDSEQYSRLQNKLTVINDGWKILDDLSEDKEKRLEKYLKSFMFFEDARQIDKMLNTQERFLMKDIQTLINTVNISKSNLLSLHEIVNENDAFIQKMEMDERSLTAVLNQGGRLIEENNYHKDRIQNKCQILNERWKKNYLAAVQRKKNLQDQLILHELLQDIDDLDDNLIEKIQGLNELTHHNKSPSSCLAQCKAMEEEINAYKSVVRDLNQRGKQVTQQFPHFQKDISQRLDNLNGTWTELTKLLEDKLQTLANSNREAVFEESTQSMMKFLEDIENQIITNDDPTEAGSCMALVNNHLKTLDSHNKELENQKRLLENLKDHSDVLKQQNPDKALQYEQLERQVKATIENLAAPLEQKLVLANQKKLGEQLLRDCDDEIDWMNDKRDLIRMKSSQIGTICNLQQFQQLQMRCKSLKTEIKNRKNKIDTLDKEAQTLIRDDHPKKDMIAESVSKLKSTWVFLNKEFDAFERQMVNQRIIQEYLLEVSDVSSWISEKELDLMNIVITVKDAQQIRRINRRQQNLELEIKNYNSKIEELRKISRDLPGSYKNIFKDVEDNYNSLKIICAEKKTEISLFAIYCKTHELFQSLESWITDRIKIAKSNDSGRDLDQCTILRDRFATFAAETNKIGSGKINEANKRFDELIRGKHPYSPSISGYKDRINEIWADLLELIDTRIQLLKSAWDLHRWYCDCQFLIECISEKTHSIQVINELGKDPKSVSILQRKLKNFEKDLSRLDTEISAAITVSNTLLPLYCKEKEAKLTQKRNELVEAFRQLRKLLEDRRVNNVELADFHSFLAMVRELVSWTEDIALRMEMRHKPRDVSGIELLLANHRTFKIEMDSKEENFSICLNLGRTLLRTKHLRSAEIKAKCKEVTERRDLLFQKWFNVLDHLSLMVEVYQWARDAASAEAWVISQESYLSNENLGMTLDETLSLLKKLILFQKTNLSQEEKFEQLKRLTTLEIRSQKLNAESNTITQAACATTEDLLEHHRFEPVHESVTIEKAQPTSRLPEQLLHSQKHQQPKQAQQYQQQQQQQVQQQQQQVQQQQQQVQQQQVQQQQYKSLQQQQHQHQQQKQQHQSQQKQYQTHQNQPQQQQQQAQQRSAGLRRFNSIDSSLDAETVLAKDQSSAINQSSTLDTQQQTNRGDRVSPLARSSTIPNTTTSPVPKKRPQPSHLSSAGRPLHHAMSASTDTLSGYSKAQKAPLQPEDIVMKGALYRKHQWENRNQKASNRSWHSLYVLVAQSRMTFFKDERHYREKPGQYYKHEMPIVLCEVVAAPAQDYNKRPCVFRVRFRNGGEYLFQGSSVVDMTRWVDAINAASKPIRQPTGPTNAGASSGPGANISVTQSHPNLSSSLPPQSHQPSGLKRFFSSIRLKK